MKTIKGIIERSKLESIVAYLMDLSELNGQRMNDYDNTIEKSFIEFYNKLEQMLPGADRKNDKLFETVATLAAIHDDIFLEVGILVGFNLYKNLELSYERLGTASTDSDRN